MIELPMNRGEVFKVTRLEERELQEAFPRVSVPEELKKMRQWLLANPNRRKKNMKRFMQNWLSNARPTIHNPAVRADESPELPGYTVSDEYVRRHIEEAKRQLRGGK